MSTPIVRGSKEENENGAMEETTCWCAWRNQQNLQLCLAGDNDDYVSDLMRVLNDVIRDQERYFNYSMRPKHINLLYHIESKTRFEKFLKRDFVEKFTETEGAVEETARAKKATDEAARAAVRVATRAAEVEKVAENTNNEGPMKKNKQSVDMDMVEKEEMSNSFLTSLGRGRGKTLPAWMTEQNGGSSSSSSSSSSSNNGSLPCIVIEDTSTNIEMLEVDKIETEGDNKTKKDEIVNGGGRGLNNAPPAVMIGRGRGRGMERTLPAWATSDIGPPPVASLVSLSPSALTSSSLSSSSSSSASSSASKRKREESVLEKEKEEEGRVSKRSRPQEDVVVAAGFAATDLLQSIVLPPPLLPPPPEDISTKLSMALSNNIVLKKRINTLENQVNTLTQQLNKR